MRRTDAIIERIGKTRDKIIPLLQALQAEFSYLPSDALKRIYEKTEINRAQVISVSSFYSQFRMVPYGKHVIKVCIGTACHVKGANTVYDAFRRELGLEGDNITTADQMPSIEKVACLGCCALAPVVQIDSKIFGHVQPGRVREVLAEFEQLANAAEKESNTKESDQQPQGEVRIGMENCCQASGTAEVHAAVLKACSELGINVYWQTVVGDNPGRLREAVGIALGRADVIITTCPFCVTNLSAQVGDRKIKVVDLTALKDLFADIKVSTFVSFPTWDLWKDAIDGVKDLSWSYVGAIAVAYVPVAFVVFAEHIADHKNISSIIEKDLLEEPGLHRTLLGDGVGSMAGAIFGGAPNTTYGESIGCVAISGNASVITIWATAILAIIISFLSPFAAFLSTIPNCVMGGVCMALYGFIAVSGLKMVQKVDLEDNRNLFVVSVILIAGIGGLSVSFGEVNITTIALALILGILTNVLLSRKKADNNINIEEQK